MERGALISAHGALMRGGEGSGCLDCCLVKVTTQSTGAVLCLSPRGPVSLRLVSWEVWGFAGNVHALLRLLHCLKEAASLMH